MPARRALPRNNPPYHTESRRRDPAAFFQTVKKLSARQEKYLRRGEKAAGAATADISGNGDGLLVNIRKRNVMNFFQKYTLLRDIHLMKNILLP